MRGGRMCRRVICDRGFEKPNPRIFQHALEMTVPGLPVWMIGDNVTADCLSVGSFGIRAILVRNETAQFTPRARDLYAASALIRAGGLGSTPSA